VSWLESTPFGIIPWACGAALLAGAGLPLLGTWIVLQRVVFMGVTLAQVAAAGVALGLLLHLPALPLGLVLCAAAIALLTRRRSGAISGDAALGAGFCLASALSLLFIMRSPADLDQVSHVLHGNLIYATPPDVLLLGAALLLATVVTLACYRPILFCAFDPETAAALGLRVRGWLLLLFGVLAVVMTTGMRTTGSLLTFALLVLPPLAALQFGRGMPGTLALSSLLGVLAATAGLCAAVRADLHVESSIVVAAFLLLPLARLWRVSPLLSLALAAGLAAAVPLLAPERAAPPGAGHEHGGEPFHLDVHLSARAAGDGRATLSWTLDIHRDDPAVPLPPALWLLVSVDGHSEEFPLVEDTAPLTGESTLLQGERSIALPPGAREITGLLWSGPSGDADALPVENASVIGCAAP
jgi:ABC-type Mn2+/Zn2+ transport system permease subunit